MKNVLFVLFLLSFISCENEASTGTTNNDTLPADTSATQPVVVTDSTGAASMNADTSGMGQAR